MLEPKLAERLNKKLETLVLHLKSLKEDKKQANASFKEQMDECQDKIDAVALTLKTGDRTMLVKAFGQYEIEGL